VAVVLKGLLGGKQGIFNLEEYERAQKDEEEIIVSKRRDSCKRQIM